MVEEEAKLCLVAALSRFLDRARGERRGGGGAIFALPWKSLGISYKA